MGWSTPCTPFSIYFFEYKKKKKLAHEPGGMLEFQIVWGILHNYAVLIVWSPFGARVAFIFAYLRFFC